MFLMMGWENLKIDEMRWLPRSHSVEVGKHNSHNGGKLATTLLYCGSTILTRLTECILS